jgi:hypothetical protein
MQNATPSSPIVNIILPELILASVACVCILLGVSRNARVRRSIPIIALVALLVMFAGVTGIVPVFGDLLVSHGQTLHDTTNIVRLNEFGWYIQSITLAMGVLLVLLAWPSTHEGTAARSIYFGHDAGEFFGLMLLSITGLMLLVISNDMILFFLGLELAALPTYIMVAISRPIEAAQEAGVKYFFLGAMAAALILFGFSYLYGATGQTDLLAIAGDEEGADRTEYMGDAGGGHADRGIFIQAGSVPVPLLRRRRLPGRRHARDGVFGIYSQDNGDGRLGEDSFCLWRRNVFSSASNFHAALGVGDLHDDGWKYPRHCAIQQRQARAGLFVDRPLGISVGGDRGADRMRGQCDV